jgi:hypothetical protein
VQILAACEGVALEWHGLWQRQVFYNGSSDIVYFTVDGTSTVIVIMPVANKTYTVTDIPLNFTLNEPASQITYTLDGQANVTITGNVTLTGLSRFTQLTMWETPAFPKLSISAWKFLS